MKALHISIIVILISTTTIVPVHALEAATPQNNDTITTSTTQIVGIRNENCDFKETFLVSGTIGMPLSNSPVLIRIYNPNGTIYDSERIPPQQISHDGKYWYSFSLIYGNNTPVGPYSITVSYNGHSAKSSVHLVLPPIIRGPPPETIRIVSNNGSDISVVKVGQPVQIEDSIQQPLCGGGPEFAYIVQVQDKNAATVSLSWIEGTFDKDKPMNFSETWMPFTAGSYTIQRYLWQSIKSPNALEPSLSKTVEVR